MPYIGKKPADIIATVIDTTTGTFSGEVDAGSLDVSGNADIDGITNLDNTDIDGTLDVSGNLTVDTSTLVVDSANNRVGVGTSSPAKILHIEGGAGGTLRLSSNDLTVGAGESLGEIDWYSNDSSGSGSGVRAFINVVENDGGLGRSYDMTFGTGDVATASEGFRLDKNGNLLVGKTSSGVANDGFEAQSTGQTVITQASADVLRLNRKTSDGTIIDLRKDGTTVGSIGTNSQHSKIAMFDSSGGFILGNTGLLPSTSAGAYNGGQRDLGTASVNWKDLYLSGTATMDGLTVGDSHTIGNDGDDNLQIATSVGENLIFKSSGNIVTYLDTNEDQSTAAYQIYGDVTSPRSLLRVEETGDISFYEDTGTTAKFFWDASTERLGIGTTSPERALHVEGAGIIKNTSGEALFKLTAANTSNSILEFADTDDGNVGRVQYEHDNNAMLLYTNDTERMRIDSSGNLLVGTTNANPAENNVAGIGALANNTLSITRDGNAPMQLNRKTSDGSIAIFRKDGTTVGSIASNSGSRIILSLGGNNNAGITGANGSNQILPTLAGSTDNNTVDLGTSTVKWKDLYLGGGVYLGGTGSANYLDDYEEGTWTPVFKDNNSTTVATSQLTAKYRKVGDLVTVEFTVQRNNSSSLTGTLYITGLPFTTTNIPALRGQMWVDNTVSDVKCFIYVGSSNTEGFMPLAGTTDSVLTTNQWVNSRYIYGQLTYLT